MHQYFFIPRRQLARLPIPFLKNTAMKPAKVHPDKWDHIFFGSMFILERKADGRQLEFILKGQRKVELTVL